MQGPSAMKSASICGPKRNPGHYLSARLFNSFALPSRRSASPTSRVSEPELTIERGSFCRTQHKALSHFVISDYVLLKPDTVLYRSSS